MTTDSNFTIPPVEEQYWTALPKFIAAMDRAVAMSHKTAGHPASSARHYWASMLYARICSAGNSVLQLCPGSPMNRGGMYWDYAAVASLVRAVIQSCLMHFYLGTEAVAEDEAQARILVMHLRDCTERLAFFRDIGGDPEQVQGFEVAAVGLRNQLAANSFFANLSEELKLSLENGATASILSEDEILDRMQILDIRGIALWGFIKGYAEGSPLSYSRIGVNNRGRGEENDNDKAHMAMALEMACEFVIRATVNMQALFETVLASALEKKPIEVGNVVSKTMIDAVLLWEGCHLGEFVPENDQGTPVLCSNCFHDEGLRLTAESIGQKDLSTCPNCNSQLGIKLNMKAIAGLAQRFFVKGTIHRTQYGGAPVVQFNKRQSTSISVAPWLEPDLKIIENVLQAGFFLYGPRLWMVGEVEPLKALQEASTRPKVIERILDEFPGRILDTDEFFYRMRVAPEHPSEASQYDPPPQVMLGNGRFDTPVLPILYGSQDLEVCLHECRVTAEDELYVAAIKPMRRLKLLDLADPPWEDINEFESLDMAVHMLFLAGRQSYEITREIADAAQKRGFDGIVYPSYFTLLRTGITPFETTFGISHRKFPGSRDYVRRTTIANLALFGRPIVEGLVRVDCVDRVILNKVDYTLNFGPVLLNIPQ